MLKVVRYTGWTLVTAGVVLLLYVVYLLFFTGLETEQAQRELLEQWRLEVGDPQAAGEPLGGATEVAGERPAGPDDRDEPDAPVDPGDAYAAVWFERPGSDGPLVHDEPLFVVEGVTHERLKLGPGHYPETAAPGETGNFAVAGHRTTYGQPFFHLDELRPGDRIHVVDRDGVEHVYEVREQRIVSPRDVWVIGPDPLETGKPMMTLTTCHPRWSSSQRLVVFAQLLGA